MADVTIHNIEKSFGPTQVLKDVDLSIQDGEFISLVGPSGCGKSTLLRIIAGLEAQDSGTISIGNRVVDEVRAADRNLSMVFQSYALYPHLTVAENIAVPLKMRQMTGLQRFPIIGPFMPGSTEASNDISQSVNSAAETLQISHLLNRKPGQLSGGQRQRVAVGRALVRQPAAFLLDEPLSNLDAKLRVHTRAEIAQLHRKLGATFIYVTHDQVEAMTMSDRIAVMMDGELLQVGSPDEIYNDPKDIRVAEFIGSPKVTVLPCDATDSGSLSIFGQSLELSLDGGVNDIRIAVRPDAMALTKKSGALLSGIVTHIENLGSEFYLHVSLPQLELPIVLKFSPSGVSGISIGDEISLTFDPEDALLFDGSGKRVYASSEIKLKQAANG